MHTKTRVKHKRVYLLVGLYVNHSARRCALGHAPSEHLNQTAHTRILIGPRKTMTPDYAGVHADLSVRWLHAQRYNFSREPIVDWIDFPILYIGSDQFQF